MKTSKIQQFLSFSLLFLLANLNLQGEQAKWLDLFNGQNNTHCIYRWIYSSVKCFALAVPWLYTSQLVVHNYSIIDPAADIDAN